MDYTFLSENYVWIIVGAVIVIMTIIGYIADKTKFGEKKDKKKNSEKKNDVISSNENQIDSIELDNSNSLIESNEMNENVEIQGENDQPTSSVETMKMNQTEELKNSFDDIQNEGHLSQENNNDFQTDTPSPLPTEEISNPTPVESSIDLTNENVQNSEEELDFKLPSIDKLNQEIADVEEDEDVWKF